MDLQALKDYLYLTLWLQVHPTPWTDAKVLPFLLMVRYEFFTLYLLKTKHLLLVAKDKAEETPAVVQKHLEMAKQHWKGEVIYVPQTITSSNRTRLIQQGVPFIVPGTQLYLPHLGMDLREHFKRLAMPPGKTFSPATQIIVLDALIHGSKETLNGIQLGEKFNCSLMTITRAMNELEETGVATVQTQGRERKLKFDLPKKDLWEKAQLYLRDPVKMSDTIFEKNAASNPRYVEAGLTALAHYSNLAEPQEKTYATDINPTMLAKTREEHLYPNWDPNQRNYLEVWSYFPQSFFTEKRVDPFSLYLSLRDNQDERIQTALEEMMGKIEW